MNDIQSSIETKWWEDDITLPKSYEIKERIFVQGKIYSVIAYDRLKDKWLSYKIDDEGTHKYKTGKSPIEVTPEEIFSLK